MTRYKTYPEYKESGVEWLGRIPNGWTVAPLKRVATLMTGLTPSTENQANYEDEETDFGWVRPEDLNENGQAVRPTKFLSASGWKLMRQVPAFSTLICCIGTIGKQGFVEHIVSTNQQITAASFTYAPRFNFYLLQSARNILEETATGNVIRILNSERLSNINFLSVPIAEAETIANFLDHETAKIDTLITKQQELIKLLKEKRQAVISHAVTKGLNPNAPMRDSGVEWLGEVPAHWITGKCGYHFSFLSGFAFPSIGFSTNEENPKLLRGINVGVSSLKWNETVYWERKQGDGLDEFVLKDGDLVIGMDRPLISDGVRVSKVTSSDLPCLLLQRVALIRVHEDLLVDYIFRFLSSEMFVAHFSPDTTGVSVPHISPDQIKNFLIPLPPIEEQSEIVTFLDERVSRFERLISEAENAIELMHERRTALISAAVTGKIDVRDWQPPSESAIAA